MKVQRALIPPQKAELQNSLFHVKAEEALCVTVQKSAKQEGLQLQQMREPRGERLCAGQRAGERKAKSKRERLVDAWAF